MKAYGRKLGGSYYEHNMNCIIPFGIYGYVVAVLKEDKEDLRSECDISLLFLLGPWIEAMCTMYLGIGE